MCFSFTSPSMLEAKEQFVENKATFLHLHHIKEQ